MAARKRAVMAAVVVALLAVIAFIVGRGSGSQPPASPSRGSNASSSAQAARAERMKSIASIAGTVRDEKQAPVAGARVCAAGFSTDLPSRLFREARCGMTDVSGAYKIGSLVEAEYTVTASAPRRRPAVFEPTLHVKIGEQRSGIDLVLGDGGVELRGSVRDITGGPIAGARISTYGLHSSAGARGETDDKGAFVVWVAPGEVSVSAEADGYVGDDKFAVLPGQTVDLVLTPASSIRGTVVDAKTGTPVIGIGVSLDIRSWNPADITDDEGHFFIDGLSPGRKLVVARGPHQFGASEGTVLVGLAQEVTGVIVRVAPAARVSAMIAYTDSVPCKAATLVLDRDNGDNQYAKALPSGEVHVDGVLPGRYSARAACEPGWTRSEPQTIDVGTSDIVGLRFVVPRPGTIRGRVLTATGEPVAGVTVNAGREAETTSDANGRYELANLEPGKHDVRAYSAHVSTPPTNDYEIEVQAGKVVERDLVVGAASLVTGSVVDTTGAPVRGLSMSVHRHYDEASTFWSHYNADVRDDGTFEVHGLTAGRYSFWPSSNTDGGSQVKVIQPKSDVLEISPPKPASIHFVLAARSAAITGTVSDANGAVSDAYVVAELEESGESAVKGTRYGEWYTTVVTDQSGRFKLTGLIEGTYTVRAMRRGGGEAIAEHVAAGGSVAMLVKPTGSIEGTVRSRTHSVENVLVYIEEEATGLRRAETMYFTAGRYALRDLPAGNYLLSAEASLRTMTKRLTLAEGQRLTGVDLDVDAGVKLTGRVVDLVTREPVSGVSVLIAMPGLRSDHPRREVLTDSAGRFTFDGLPPGTLELRTYHKERGETDVVRELASSAVDLGELPVGVPVPDDKKQGELGIRFANAYSGSARRFEVQSVVPPAAGVLAVGDIIVSVNGIDVTGINHAAGFSLFKVVPGTAVKLGLASGKTVTIVAAKP